MTNSIVALLNTRANLLLSSCDITMEYTGKTNALYIRN